MWQAPKKCKILTFFKREVAIQNPSGNEERICGRASLFDPRAVARFL